jgi:ribA/ribD-fused uncharacterized protein
MTATMRIESFTGPYRFLSNFEPCPIYYGGIHFYHVEGAYVAAKTLDLELRKEIATIVEAGKVKRKGRQIELCPDWEEEKLSIMESLLRRKFEQGGELAEKLLATNDAELIEGNWWGDVFWGVCRGKGENHLGKLLMKIREELRCENLNSESPI